MLKNVLVIGGGTGTFVCLQGLKNYNFNLSAIITMMDSGGSTGRLRDQLGVLPPGDIRQALVALSESTEIWRKLFSYRFEEGDLKGHNFGNVFLSALEKVTGSFELAVDTAGVVLKTCGSVIPVTLQNTNLCVKLKNGKIVEGETNIEDLNSRSSQINYAYLSSEVSANPKALNALMKSDFIIIGPGDLFTSIIPNLLVTDISKSIVQSSAKKIFVMNLMTKPGQTSNFSASKHLKILEKYLGAGCVDFVIVNTKLPPKEILKWYKDSSGAEWVIDDFNTKDKRVIRGDFLSDVKYEQSLSDRIKRSLVRHDSKKLGKILNQIFNF